ncbi:hypothetical protein LQ50_21075 [Halalkalibacter okhensis]|uniref:Uncharacterized protein n=2 Tax=Halalkalibacter okhensis TaxID=333138 RepID=A0A0B0IEL3_9BACI|nr:hypothetical protein LQ50_21075 [Halalkalibacter okhensis]
MQTLMFGQKKAKFGLNKYQVGQQIPQFRQNMVQIGQQAIMMPDFLCLELLIIHYLLSFFHLTIVNHYFSLL